MPAPTLVTGALFNAANVETGYALAYIAPPYTPMPADSSALFDPTNWCGLTLNANSATAAILTVVTANGSAATASVNPTTITATALQAAIAALANVGAGNVLVTAFTGGFRLLFNGGLGAVTITLGTQTGGPATITYPLWMPAGGSDQGWQANSTKQTSDVRFEEQSTSAGKTLDSQVFNFSASLVEDVVQTWQWGFNTTKVVTAASSGQPGKTELFLSDTITHYAVALEMANLYTDSNGLHLPRRIYVPDMVCLASPNVAFRRAGGNKRMVAVNFESVCATNLIKVQEITAVALP